MKKTYTYEQAKAEVDSMPIKTRLYMKNHHKSLYFMAKNNGWLDSLIPLRKQYKDYTYEDFVDMVKRKGISTRIEIGNRISQECFSMFNKKGWIDKLFPRLSHTPYTDEELWEEVNKYNSISELRKHSVSVYSHITQHKRQKEFFGKYHAPEKPLPRGIYVYEFPDHSAYIGLTWNFTDRFCEHKNCKRSGVYKHQESTGLVPERKILHPCTLGDKEAKEKEAFWIEEYRNTGWNILNIAKAGSLGYGRYKNPYTLQECRSFCTGITKREDLKSKNYRMFNQCRQNGWLDILFPQTIGWRMYRGKVTLDEVQRYIDEHNISTKRQLHNEIRYLYDHWEEYKDKVHLWKKY